MPKRFTETSKWSDPWFIELSPIHKIIWLYLCDSCDVAGFWPVSLKILGYFTGAEKCDWESFLDLAGERRLRIIDFEGQPKAWLVKFLQFQFPRGFANKDPNRIAVHRILCMAPIEDLVRTLQGPYKDLIRGLVAPQEKEKEKEKEKVQDQDSRGGMGGFFQKPTIEAIKLQCAKIGLPDEQGQQFFDHYESNGWKVGKVHMRSWPSALNNWKVNHTNGVYGKTTQTGRINNVENPRNAGVCRAGPSFAELAKAKQIRQQHENGVPSVESQVVKSETGS